MNLYKGILLVFLAVVLVVGCAKKKEDAAKLQDEILQQEGAVADSSAMAQAPVDTTALIGDASAVPPQEKSKVMPRRPQGDGYTVQIAGCEDQNYAQHLIELYTERGYEPYMTTADVNGQTFYRVRIGAYANLSEAVALKTELVDKYSVQAWVDQVQ